ncbi:MAG TPA: hypothetical protein VLK65_04610 [Vicinamibacteria bacterium]|nr:hypothetical protein [Vicinamibacteria bacterium]
MRAESSPGKASMAILTAASLLFSEMAPLLPAQTAPAPAREAGEQEEVDGGWPKTYSMPGGESVVIYQPQAASWDRQKHLVAFSAVSYGAPGTDKPALGSIKLETDTSVSLDERLVRFGTIDLTETHFPTLTREHTGEVTTFIRDSILEKERVIALDRLMAAVETSPILPQEVEGVKSDPPTIFYSTSPAILVNVDGETIWSPIAENDLRFAVNTNWDLFEHGPSKTFYLRNEESWLKASDVKGPWTPASELPGSFAKLPNEENWKEVKASLPGKKLDPKKDPKVFLSFVPAEMILVQGEPKYEAVEGTQILWVSNTESDVFRVGQKGTVYYVVAGRWFSAADFTGPWIFATPTLPEDFKKIPLEHPRSRVLAAIPGTRQAAEAVLLAQIPETARVNIKELKAPPVTYQGEPQFEPVPQAAPVHSAVNTDKDIFKIGDMYYMCYNGVWFSSKAPNGPWEVETNVPKEIYNIPASSSQHHVTYVTVEDDDDSDEWATFAVVAGYTGLMIAWGCAVWGSGWYYPPYVGWGGYYPVYYPRYPTYGYSAWYNPWTGGYGRGVRAYGPYGGAGAGARYNPRTGTYARGASAWGPYGSRGVAEAWNPRTGAYGRTRQGSNVYGSWGSTSVQRGDDWAQTARYSNRATGTTSRVTRTDEGAMASRRGAGGGAVAVGEGGNVYAGRDGNVYRREDGNWQKHDNGNWNNVDPPPRATPSQRATPSTTRSSTRSVDSSTYGQLQRDSSTRAEGAQRTRDYSSYRSGSSGSAGSFRGSGGARRGGGRRR